MHTANSAQSRNFGSRRTHPRILDWKEVGGAHFITHPSHYLTGPATAFARWTKMCGKVLSSASPVMLRCNTLVQDPDHSLGWGFLQNAGGLGWAQAQKGHRAEEWPTWFWVCLVRSDALCLEEGLGKQVMSWRCWAQRGGLTSNMLEMMSKRNI